MPEDPEAEVHGSHQVGLWDEHSDPWVEVSLFVVSTVATCLYNLIIIIYIYIRYHYLIVSTHWLVDDPSLWSNMASVRGEYQFCGSLDNACIKFSMVARRSHLR